MSDLRVDDILSMLPDLDELAPLVDRVIAVSVPDPERRWSGSGELGTAAERLVRPGSLDGEPERLAGSVARHLEGVYTKVVEAVEALAAGEAGTAAGALLDAGLAEESARRLEAAEAYALAAHRIARRLRDRSPAALALRRAARAARGLGRLDVASRRYEEAYRAGRDGGDSNGAVVSAIGRGNVSVDRGLWEEAEIWYRRALELLESIGDAPRIERWQVFLNLSIVRRRRGDPEGSASWIERAEEEADAVEDPDAPAIIENARGQLLLTTDRPEEAESALRRALELAAEPKARVTIGVNLADALVRQGRALDAFEVARAAEETAILGGVVPKLPEVYRILGEIARERELAEAFVFFERALEITRERVLPEFERAQTLVAYARLELESGASDRARMRLEEADAIYDELGIQHQRREVRELLGGLEDDPAPGDAT